MADAIQCHYEVLGVSQDADASAIKKAHRKLALKYHPDKQQADNTATEKFRLVQEAYECLSDPVERRWYDDHREAILKGWSSTSSKDDCPDMSFDVTPFVQARCFRGYNSDDKDNFYAVYQRVFAAVFDEEHENESLIRDFGTHDSVWDDVARFYQQWESFQSARNFSWADEYDPQTADQRRIRRAMEDENKKLRRAARKERNQQIQTLVHFVKRRDQRVQKRRRELEQEKLQRERQLKQESAERKKKNAEDREQWRQEAEANMAVLEEEDRLAGRVRLADLDDDYDYGGKKGKGRKKKGKKKAPKQEYATRNVDENDSQEDNNEDGLWNNREDNADLHSHTDDSKEEISSMSKKTNDGGAGSGAPHEESEDSIDASSKEEETEEPDFWRCECCNKDFKSEGQMENHLRSKKHKAAYKKFLAQK